MKESVWKKTLKLDNYKIEEVPPKFEGKVRTTITAPISNQMSA
jgi:hypothetical protein